jgi:hypothetical protein
MAVDSLYRTCLLFLKDNPGVINCERMHFQAINDLTTICNNPLHLKEIPTIKVRLLHSYKNFRALMTKVLYNRYPEDFIEIDDYGDATPTFVQDIYKKTISTYIMAVGDEIYETAIDIKISMYRHALDTTLYDLSNNAPKDIVAEYLKNTKDNLKINHGQILLLVSSVNSENLLLKDAEELKIVSKVFDFPKNLAHYNE